MTYVDSTILNVALPAIRRAFHASVSDLQWVTDAYLLVLASLLILSGSIADRVGRRRVFSSGLLLFSAGSLLCSLAPGVGPLVAFRMLQALGGCMLTPVSLSIVRQVFTDPVERAKALGIWSAIFGTGVASGPILGGALVSGIAWRSVFWVNVPVGLAAWALTRRYVPESRAPTPRRTDLPGQALVIVLLGSLTFAVIEGPTLGWASPAIIVPFAAGAAAAAALMVVESRRRQPLIELRFFRSPPFTAATVIAAGSFFVLSGFLFLNTLYLQEVRGDSALVAGLSVLPATAIIAVCSPFAGRLVARYGPRPPLVMAGLFMAAGAAVLLGMTPGTSYPVLAASYVLLGIGFGLVNPPITSTAVSGMPAAQAGVASAIASTARQIGSVLGVAVMGAMVTTSAFGSSRLNRRAGASFTAATHLPWMLAAACGVACAVVALVCTGRRGLAAATRVYADDTPVAPPVQAAP
jgi:EmrB/QacA subfamily drug resistance transporter